MHRRFPFNDRIAAAVLFLAGWTAPAVRAAPPEVQIDTGDAAVSKVVAEVRAEHAVPGLAAGRFRVDSRSGKLTGAVAASGVRDGLRGDPLRAGDRFHLGSCTKAMTGTLLGLLVQDGRLAWSDRPVEILAEALRTSPPKDAYRAVTLEELLTHRSGLLANVGWPEIAARGGSVVEQRRLAAAEALCAPPACGRGAYLYSNAGYAVAGAMAEQVTGEAWETLMRERLFAPLGMTSAGFGPPAEGPTGHLRSGDRWVPSSADNPPVLGPAGTVHADLADWARFVAVYVDSHWAEPIGLERATLARLRTPPEGADYAFGWIVAERDDGGTTLTHDGSNTLWYASVRAYPATGEIYLAAANAAGDAGRQACQRTIERLVAAFGRTESAGDGRASDPHRTGG